LLDKVVAYDNDNTQPAVIVDGKTFRTFLPDGVYTGQVTDMSYVIGGMNNFNNEISYWDTSNVTNMEGMFYLANAFNKPVSFDTSKVTNMSAMFATTNAFNSPVSIDTSSVTNMEFMFYQAKVFNNPVSFNTINVTSV